MRHREAWAEGTGWFLEPVEAGRIPNISLTKIFTVLQQEKRPEFPDPVSHRVRFFFWILRQLGCACARLYGLSRTDVFVELCSRLL